MSDSTPTVGDTLALDQLKVGDLLGKWTVLKVYHFGLTHGMYQVKHAEGHTRALAVFPVLASSDPHFSWCLEQLVTSLKLCKHPALHKPLELFKEQGREGIVFEDLPGDSLGVQMQQIHENSGGLEAPDQNPPLGALLNPPQAEVFLANLANLLAKIHELSILHLDLSPYNLYRKPDGSPVLTAVGFFEAIDPARLRQIVSAYTLPLQSSASPKVYDTLDMRSPEWRSGAPMTYSSDIYQFGLLAVNLLTGCKLRDTSFPFNMRPTLGKGWTIFAKKCLSPEPQIQYLNMTLLEGDLRSIDRISGVRQNHGSSFSFDQIKDILSRNRKVALISAGALVGLIGLKVLSDSFAPSGSSDNPVVAQANWAGMDITALPGSIVEAVAGNGAVVWVGTVGENGTLKLEDRFIPGDITLRLTHPACAPQQESFRLRSSKSTEWVPVQQPLECKLSVSGPDEGVRVYVNNDYVGNTPLDAPVVPSSEATVSLRKDGFRSIEKKFDLASGTEVSWAFPALEPCIGKLRLQVSFGDNNQFRSDLNAVKILLKDQTYSLYSLPTEFPAETVDLLVSHPDYEEAHIKVAVQDREELKQAVILKPKPAHLDVAVQAGVNYELTVNGYRYDSNRMVFEAGKDYDLRVEAHDYYNMYRQWTPLPNEQLTWDVGLKQLPPPTVGENWDVPYIGVSMLWLNPGTYQMGSPLEEAGRRPQEGPVTEITLTKGFWMGQFEVRLQEFLMLMPKHKNSFEKANLPVESVTWKEAAYFCRLLTEQEGIAGRLPEGYEYRLPTQAEWEYACRAGTQSPFNFGDTANITQGRFSGHYPRYERYEGEDENTALYGPVEVGSYAPNAWGFFDMHGNVAEYCLDPFNSQYPGEKQVDWQGSVNGRLAPIRGGSWMSHVELCRSAFRDRMGRTTRNDHVGFRVVLAPENHIKYDYGL